MKKSFPNSLWMFTQFTWLTTLSIFIILIIRVVDKKYPKWFNWTKSHGTLAYLGMFDLVVGIVYWAALSHGMDNRFNPDIRNFQLTITVVAHTIIPFLFLTYTFYELFASKLTIKLSQKSFLFGMIFPTFYVIYYLIISVIFHDPYSITNLHKEFLKYIWVLPIGLIGFGLLLESFILLNNFGFLKLKQKLSSRS